MEWDKQLRMEWAEKYRPITLNHVKGNDKAISTIRKWATAWEQGSPTKKGLILAGKPGTGKTSAAHALASDFKWGVIELNASDARNAENIKRIALAGSVNETFTASGEFITAQSGGRKLIILDEADNLFERMKRTASTNKETADMSDRGGKAAIIETLRKTHQPVIMIVNDLYELTRDSGVVIKQHSEIVKFIKLRKATIRLLLKRICEHEGVEITPNALDELSRRADGDMRSAINDLQLLAEGNKKIDISHISSVGYRNVRSTIFDAVREILGSTNCERAQKAVWDLNESPEDIILWLDENLPLEYRRPADLRRGFEALSRADIFLGRIRRRQYYGLWAYAKDLMTSGVAMAKAERYHGWVNYQFPSWLLQMSRTKSIRQLQKSVAGKIGSYSHTSKAEVKKDILPFFRYIYKSDHTFAVNMSINLEFSKEEIGWLISENVTSNKVKYLMGEIKKSMERMSHQTSKESRPEIFPSGDQDEDESDSSGDKENKNAKIEEDTSSRKSQIKDKTPNKDKENGKSEKKVQKNLFDY